MEAGSFRILVVRLGAMGDVIHALPAAASLKQSLPRCHLTWIIEPRWAPLLSDNPYIDRVLHLNRGSFAGLAGSWRELRSQRYDLAVDFQGLLKSSLVARASGAAEIAGFHPSQIRERAAAAFYTRRIATVAAHVVDQNLELARAVGASSQLRAFHLPRGREEGELPRGEFVLASPRAGWQSKQWPMEHYEALAAGLRREFGIPLVLNLPPDSPAPGSSHALVHRSSIEGLIHATRRAAAVVGVDSGPLHLAAALGQRGVAIFGPTDPARNGPYGESLTVLRSPEAQTTYRRGTVIDSSMENIAPGQVLEALRIVLRRCPA